MEFFNSIRSEIVNNIDLDGKIISEIIYKFQCDKCKNWFKFSDIENYYIPCSLSHVPNIHKITFMCKHCSK